MPKRLLPLALLVPLTIGLAVAGGAAHAHHSGSCGQASWYALDGRTTANGERMSSKVMTAAHKFLPFGTKVRVTNLRNGKSVVVRINDRGPFIGGRVIDVTRAAARRLGFRSRGVARVALQVVGGRNHGRLCS